jgi:hypothetical protein
MLGKLQAAREKAEAVAAQVCVRAEYLASSPGLIAGFKELRGMAACRPDPVDQQAL